MDGIDATGMVLNTPPPDDVDAFGTPAATIHQMPSTPWPFMSPDFLSLMKVWSGAPSPVSCRCSPARIATPNVDHVVLCWLRVQHIELTYTQVMDTAMLMTSAGLYRPIADYVCWLLGSSTRQLYNRRT